MPANTLSFLRPERHSRNRNRNNQHMLSVIAISALGSIKTCTSADPATATCDGECTDVPDSMFGKCQGNGMGVYVKGTCSGSSNIRSAIHTKEDCSDDVSKTCVGLEVLTGGCSIVFKIGECKDGTKMTGTCPGAAAADDEPCFSREAEACRVLDTSVAPFAAFRACFDEPAPTVAER
eukprot:scaffold41407_cov60-Phaeocystis_antarctica.AAC.1